MKRMTTTKSPAVRRRSMFTLAAIASLVLAGCAHTGMQGDMDHAAMGSGTAGGMGMGMMKGGADCPMMSAEQRKMMCDGKSDDECKRMVDEHRQAMEKRMKDHMMKGNSSTAPADMCDMGKAKP